MNASTIDDLSDVPMVDMQDRMMIAQDCERKMEENGNNNEIDVYSYTKFNEFTSEIFKIEIQNLPKYMTPLELKKLFKNKFKLEVKKVKVIKGFGNKPGFGFVTFCNDADRDKAIESVNNYVLKKHKLRVVKAKPSKDPAMDKKIQTDSKIAVKFDELSEDELQRLLFNQVCPLWCKDYKTQLEEKQSMHSELLRALLDEIRMLYDQKVKHTVKTGDAVASIYEGIRFVTNEPSNYRNKCEFTVGMDGVVGFRLGTYRDDNVKVVKPVNCPLVNDRMEKLVDLFEQFIKTSQLKPFNFYNHQGNFKQITIRTSEHGCMLIVSINRDAELNEAKLDDEIKRLVSLIRDQASYVTSVYIQVSGRQLNDRSEKNNVLENVHGDLHLCEEMRNGELKYRISPFAFFQVNSKATQILYDTICELANLNTNVILLDICCGVGTIGIYLARQKVKYVIGVELNKEAVEDAKHNAELNKVENIEFYAGLAEENLSKMIQRAEKIDSNAEIVAILDPPRVGLKNSIIRLIRHCSDISRLVYVACEPKQSKQNLIDLSRPTSNAYQGAPFEIMKAVSVDMFPHTTNCELVTLLKRKINVENEQTAKRTIDEAAHDSNFAGTLNSTMGKISNLESVMPCSRLVIKPSDQEQTNVDEKEPK